MSGLFGGGNAKLGQALKGMRAQTSVYGSVIPIAYGRVRMSGNVIEYTDFKANKVKVQGGKGGMFGSSGKGGNQYQYQAAVAIALCMGRIKGVRNIYDSAGLLTLNQAIETFTVPSGGGNYTVVNSGTNFYGNLGVTRGDSYSISVADFGNPNGPQVLTGTQQTPMVNTGATPGIGQYKVSSTGTYTFSAADVGKLMTITYDWAQPNTTNNGQPLTLAQFAQFLGAQGQAAWSYLLTNHPSQAIPYSGLAYLANSVANLGNSGAMSNYSYEVDALLQYGGGIPDAEPSAVITDLLTNALYGLGYPANEIASLTQYMNFCVANGLFISPVFDTDQPAAQWIGDIISATNSDAFISQGLLNIAPYGDTSAVGNGVVYIANTTPIYDLTDDDFVPQGANVDPVTITRPTIADVFNNVKVEYLDRSNAYNPVVLEEFDQNSIETYRKRQTSPTQMHFYTSAASAQAAANMMLKRQVYIRNQYQFTLDRRYVLLDPMDLVTLTDSNLGLSKQPCRIREIKEQQDGSLQFTAEDFPFGTATPSLYSKQSALPFIPNANADPGSVNAPIIVEANNRVTAQQGYQLWFGVSGSNPNWGGCHIWISADNATFKQIKDINGNPAVANPARMGVLTSQLLTSADPDTVDSIGVDLTQSSGQLLSGTAADCDNFRTLCLIDNELISYQTATLGAAFNYFLATRIRRGVFGSAMAVHNIGAPFLRIDEAVFKYQFDPTLIGSTIFFKFTSFNLLGQMEQGVQAVTSYPVTLLGTFTGAVELSSGAVGPQMSGGTVVVDNGNFEAGLALPPPGWVTYIDPVVGLTYDTVTPFSGKQSIKITATGQGGIAAARKYACRVGDVFRISARAWLVSGTGPAVAAITFRNAAGTALLDATASTSAGAWTPVSGSAIAPVSSVFFTIELYLQAGGVAEFDEVHIARMQTAFEVTPINTSGASTGSGALSQSGVSTTILIAASTFQFGDGTVSYNSGSVNPLSLGKWYVYADDPGFNGGAVSYQFTASESVLYAGNGRIPFGVITTVGGGGAVSTNRPGTGGARLALL